MTNPLSVKTKAHTARSPNALMSPSEREKVFLEVHIQNLTSTSIWFEKMWLEPVDGWQVENEDAPVSNEGEKREESNGLSVFSGSIAPMQPQDLRQYIFVMMPKQNKTSRSIPQPPVPGTVVPLGRLDISWRSSMGEPGRLLTSVRSHICSFCCQGLNHHS